MLIFEQRVDEFPSNSPNLYPVIVYIHGGGFVVGASQQYPGVFLAERNVVVVTFNYRLGPLGLFYNYILDVFYYFFITYFI